METISPALAQPAFRGRVIASGDPDYHTARSVHNGMIDKYPDLIVRCADEEDVVRGCKFCPRTPPVASGKEVGIMVPASAYA